MSLFNIIISLIFLLCILVYFLVGNKIGNENSVLEKIRKVLLPFIIAGIIFGGTIYYQTQDISFSHKVLLIIQNILGAFFGNPELKIKDMSELITENVSFQSFAGMLYSISVLIAPLLTVVTVCSLLDKLVDLRLLRIYFNPLYKLANKVVVFGYNATIENWIKENNNDDEKKEFIIFTNEKINEEIKSKFAKKYKNVIFATYNENNFILNIDSLLNKAGFNKDDFLIIFDDKNQFVNYDVLEKVLKLKSVKDGTRVFINAINDVEANRILKFYESIREGKKFNLEIFNLKDYVVSNLLDENPEYKYFNDYNKYNNIVIHKLIIGFGTTGQKFLLQSMNTSVLTSKNDIVFDVFDKDIKNNKEEFLSGLSRSSWCYNDLNKDLCYIVFNDKEKNGTEESTLNGKLVIRFHELDIKHNKTNNMIDDCALLDGEVPYTSVFIELPTSELVNNVYEKIERHISKNSILYENGINLFIREYEGINKNCFNRLRNKNIRLRFFDVFNVKLSKLLKNEIIENAKRVNYIYDCVYGCINEIDKDARYETINQNLDLIKSGEKCNNKNELKKNINEKWLKLPYFKKQSSVANVISKDKKIFQLMINHWENDFIKSLKNAFIGKDGLAKRIFDDPLLREMSETEHRRWCYFMISQGWGQTDKDKKRDNLIKKHNCLLSYEDLYNDSELKNSICNDLIILFLLEKDDFKKFHDKNNLLCFWLADKEFGYFSNWYLSDFVVDGKEFHSGEQWFMYSKAKLFNDEEIAKKILNVELNCSNDNKIVKELGREVRNFDETKWKFNCDELICKGLIAKFSQNDDLKKKLLDTGDKELVEASPYDKVWGIGMEESPEVYDKSNWKGENRLGKVLMRVRDELKNNL